MALGKGRGILLQLLGSLFHQNILGHGHCLSQVHAPVVTSPLSQQHALQLHSSVMPVGSGVQIGVYQFLGANSVLFLHNQVANEQEATLGEPLITCSLVI